MWPLPWQLLLAGIPGDSFLFTCIPDLYKINIANLRTGVRNVSLKAQVLMLTSPLRTGIEQARDRQYNMVIEKMLVESESDSTKAVQQSDPIR